MSSVARENELDSAIKIWRCKDSVYLWTDYYRYDNNIKELFINNTKITGIEAMSIPAICIKT